MRCHHNCISGEIDITTRCFNLNSLNVYGLISGRATYIVVLKVCADSVSQNQAVSTRGTYHTIRISSLELTKVVLLHSSSVIGWVLEVSPDEL
ncbi:hypothetical protein L6164_027111 [Bauhinia variegata]|uniref:Uncharacterized protein n=1 Tax=Bauhinia variegata TaxID=167791 RepID=A0ACB9LS63_BAUVA|nr:hypothetical protein L6164_027111 [Bauhinia variegata]